MVRETAPSVDSKAKRFENWVLRGEQWIIAGLWAAMVGGLAISLYFTIRNPPMAIAFASTVIGVIFGAAGVMVEKKHALRIALGGIILAAGVYVWGFEDLVCPYKHIIAIKGVESGYAIDIKNCDFTDQKVFVCPKL